MNGTLGRAFEENEALFIQIILGKGTSVVISLSLVIIVGVQTRNSQERTSAG